MLILDLAIRNLQYSKNINENVSYEYIQLLILCFSGVIGYLIIFKLGILFLNSKTALGM